MLHLRDATNAQQAGQVRQRVLVVDFHHMRLLLSQDLAQRAAGCKIAMGI